MASVSLARSLSGRHIPALDGLRGCSAWLVVFAHLGLLPGGYGFLGVAVFFVLSGFLITWLLLDETQSTGAVSLGNFYLRRTLRIFPAFYVFWILQIFAFKLIHQHISPSEVTAAFFYCTDYYAAFVSRSGGSMTHIMGPTWSLGVEEKFYLLWPWCFVLCLRRPRRLAAIAGGIVLAVFVYRAIGVEFTPVAPDYFSYAFESRLDNIMMGCFLALLIKNWNFSRLWNALAPSPELPFAIVSALALATFVNGRSPRFLSSVGLTVDAILIAVLLVQLISWSSHPLWSWLDAPVMRFFGRISYSLYLYHWMVIFLVDHYLPAVRWRYQVAAVVLGSVVASYLSYRFIETPFLRLKHRFERQSAPLARRAHAGG